MGRGIVQFKTGVSNDLVVAKKLDVAKVATAILRQVSIVSASVFDVSMINGSVTRVIFILGEMMYRFCVKYRVNKFYADKGATIQKSEADDKRRPHYSH